MCGILSTVTSAAKAADPFGYLNLQFPLVMVIVMF